MRTCNACKKQIAPHEFQTEINPEGGYGRPRFAVCDDCLPDYLRPSLRDALERYTPISDEDAAKLKAALDKKSAWTA